VQNINRNISPKPLGGLSGEQKHKTLAWEAIIEENTGGQERAWDEKYQYDDDRIDDGCSTTTDPPPRGGGGGGGGGASLHAGVIRHSKSRRALRFSMASAPLLNGENSATLLFAGERWRDVHILWNV
jgi:hypothetical protein